MNSRTIKIISVLTIFQFKVHAQVAVSYIPFQSLLGISSNTNKLTYADFKLETNTFASNLNMELSPKINFKRKELVNFYCGPGVSFNPVYFTSDLPVLNGYFLDLGTRMMPFKNYKPVQLLFEISPYINNQFGSGNIRTRLGISYCFNSKSKDKNKATNILNDEKTIESK